MPRPVNPHPPEKDASHELPPPLRQWEAALASLVPRADSLDRDAILFRAGQQAAQTALRRRPSRLFLQAGLAASAALAGSLLTFWLARPEPQVIERVRIVKVEVPVQAEPAGAASPPPSANPTPIAWPEPQSLADRPRARALEEFARSLREPDFPSVSPDNSLPTYSKPPEPKLYHERIQAMLDETLSGPPAANSSMAPF